MFCLGISSKQRTRAERETGSIAGKQERRGIGCVAKTAGCLAGRDGKGRLIHQKHKAISDQCLIKSEQFCQLRFGILEHSIFVKHCAAAALFDPGV